MKHWVWPRVTEKATSGKCQDVSRHGSGPHIKGKCSVDPWFVISFNTYISFTYLFFSSFFFFWQKINSSNEILVEDRYVKLWGEEWRCGTLCFCFAISCSQCLSRTLANMSFSGWSINGYQLWYVKNEESRVSPPVIVNKNKTKKNVSISGDADLNTVRAAHNPKPLK